MVNNIIMVVNLELLDVIIIIDGIVVVCEND